MELRFTLKHANRVSSGLNDFEETRKHHWNSPRVAALDNSRLLAISGFKFRILRCPDHHPNPSLQKHATLFSLDVAW
jgi:hypothetical protein